MTLGGFHSSAAASLAELYPGPEAGNIVSILCEELLGVSPYRHITEPSLRLSSSEHSSLLSAMARLRSGEPLQYVLGYAWFYGRRYKVDRRVLIPRPETELLVSAAVELARPLSAPRILDLCTGSGCIAWTLALELPGSSVTALDISSGALSVARSQNFDPASMPSFVEADVLSPSSMEGLGTFDVIVSNPPYVMDSQRREMRPNVLDWEPSQAIFVRDDDPLVFYRAVAGWASELLRAGGYGVVEINDILPGETLSIFETEFPSSCSLRNDLSSRPRNIVFRKPA